MAGSSEEAGKAEAARCAREYKTITAMLRMYCRRHHHPDGVLCGDCAALQAYACRRIERCVFGDNKPTCANCAVHCYKPARREQVRVVMRWAGPRMLWKHPMLALRHKLDGRLPAPSLQRVR